MKQSILILTFILLFITSCSDNKMRQLNEKISILEKENLLLKDSIKNLSKIDLETRLFGIPSKEYFNLNEEGEIFFSFLKTKETIPYNIYEANENFKKGKLLYSNITKTEFIHKFTPTKSGIKKIKLIAEIRNGKYITEIPGYISVNVKKLK